MSTHYEGACDYCDEHSDFLRILDGAPFPPKLCPECYEIASDGPQGEPDTDPRNKPLTPMENMEQDEHHCR